jgi:hypothetical protein
MEPALNEGKKDQIKRVPVGEGKTSGSYIDLIK